MDRNSVLVSVGLVILGGFLAFLFLRNKPMPTALARQYTNKEEWQISWSTEGFPTRVVIHREARQQSTTP